jgi:hypothetical protein
VEPTVIELDVGVTAMESSPEVLLQPVKVTAMQASKNVPKLKRFNIWVSWRFQQLGFAIPWRNRRFSSTLDYMPLNNCAPIP